LLVKFLSGYDTEGRCPLNTVEVFTPSTETWQTSCPLTVPRRRFGVAVVNSIIYVVGGYGEETVEYYNEVKERWVVVKGLVINRFECSCLSMQPPNCL
jgi:hypothetical protein